MQILKLIFQNAKFEATFVRPESNDDDTADETYDGFEMLEKNVIDHLIFA